MTNYLRNRPFLCVEITYRANPKKTTVNTTSSAASLKEVFVYDTRKAGWQDNKGALKAYDRVVIVDRVNRPEKFQVIIDVINSEVIRNSTEVDATELRAEYMSRYKEEIKDALTIWAMREAKARQADEAASE